MFCIKGHTKYLPSISLLLCKRQIDGENFTIFWWKKIKNCKCNDIPIPFLQVGDNFQNMVTYFKVESTLAAR